MFVFVAMHNGRVERVNVAPSLEKLYEPFRLHTSMEWDSYQRFPDSLDPDLYGSTIMEAEDDDEVWSTVGRADSDASGTD